MVLSLRAVLLSLFLALLASTTGAHGAIYQGDVVIEDPVNYTPRLFYSGDGPKPHVDSIDQSGNTIYAGGLFDAVVDKRGVQHARLNLMAFDADTGDVLTSFDARVDRTVWAVKATDNAVYIGGGFKTVNGVDRAALAKLDPVTGALDRSFRPPFAGGHINEIEMVNGRLIIAGTFRKKLMALDPATGKDTGYINLGIEGDIPNTNGPASVFRFAVHPDENMLAAVGNFTTVSGQSRTRFFMADLGPNSATLNPWYYKHFATPCSATTVGDKRRIAYLQGVDFSPTGDYFVVTATGRVSRPGELDKTVCDAAARFETNVPNPDRPTWINYTGGDSVWTAAVTGSAVYVQGHFEWLDNRNGFASTCPEGDPCARRLGVGAIDPETGLALPWDPSAQIRLGGKDFLVTSRGLWVGSDATRFNGERRRGIAFVTLPNQPPPEPAPIDHVGSDTLAGSRQMFPVTVPSTVEAGDGMLLFFSVNNVARTVTPPAGWTAVDSVATSDTATHLWQRVAQAGDAGSTPTVSLDGMAKGAATLLAYSGTAATGPVAEHAAAAETTFTSNHVTPVVDVTTPGAWVVSYWSDRGDSTTAWTLPARLTQRSAVYGELLNRVTGVSGDPGAAVSSGPYGGLTASADAASKHATMWTTVLAPAS